MSNTRKKKQDEKNPFFFPNGDSSAWRGPKDCTALCAHGGEQQQKHVQTPCTFYTRTSKCATTCDKCQHGKQAAVNCASECYQVALKDMNTHKPGAVAAQKECIRNCNSSFFCACADEDE